MSHIFTNQLVENGQISEVYRLTDKALRPNKNGVLYMQFTLSDRAGGVSARLWNATDDLFAKFNDGDFVRCDGAVQRYMGNLQIIARKLTKVPASEVDLKDFSRESNADLQALLERLRSMLGEIKYAPLRDLADCFLMDDDFMKRFSRAFAGVRLHHAYPGGLLEHTVSMMEIARLIAPIYGEKLDADVLLMGAFLHDVGKTVELSDDLTSPTYTDAGQALGHSCLGVEILARKIEELERATGEPFDARLAVALKHMIVSHHGTLENGAAKTPASVEAIALHYIDSLDAKIAEFHKHISEDPNPGAFWTNFIPILDRKLIKWSR
ncbi:MAG: HD domain-containing protein [Thermoguttaceae bacterium]|nr:HD domain-containing protein [Thermoguttaceae bacterium]